MLNLVLSVPQHQVSSLSKWIPASPLLLGASLLLPELTGMPVLWEALIPTCLPFDSPAVLYPPPPGPGVSLPSGSSQLGVDTFPFVFSNPHSLSPKAGLEYSPAKGQMTHWLANSVPFLLPNCSFPNFQTTHHLKHLVPYFGLF